MKLELVERAGETEAKLMEHPGVRQAAVFLWKPSAPDNRLVAYVVPDKEYLDRTLAGADDESRRIQKWRKTYDLTQSGKSTALQPDFNILGWNSSYARLAIPESRAFFRKHFQSGRIALPADASVRRAFPHRTKMRA